MAKEKLIVILGPTASGKTGLSIELAKKLDTEIISGDSMLVYKGFDIGSAKPTEEEKSGIVHHMIDILEPEEKFNVADFVTEVKKLISEINAKGKIPILAGGTGLYIKSLLEGYEFNETAGDSKYRAYLEKLAEEKGREFVFDMLKKDPEFQELFKKSKGFCLPHFGDLMEAAEKRLNDAQKKELYPQIFAMMQENMERVQKDVAWFVEKNDYRNKDKDWGESRDSIQRAMQKCAGGYPADPVFKLEP